MTKLTTSGEPQRYALFDRELSGGDAPERHGVQANQTDFVANDRPIESGDVVLWHVFGLHHSVRVEDFPVQPCITTGFKLMPYGFFNGNPAIDLPSETNTASRFANASV